MSYFGLKQEKIDDAIKLCKQQFKQKGLKEHLKGPVLAKYIVDNQKQIWRNQEKLGKFLLQNNFITKDTYSKAMGKYHKQSEKEKKPIQQQFLIPQISPNLETENIKKDILDTIDAMNQTIRQMKDSLRPYIKPKKRKQVFKEEEEEIDIDKVEAFFIPAQPDSNETEENQEFDETKSYAAFFNEQFPLNHQLSVLENIHVIEEKWKNLPLSEKKKYKLVK